MSIAKVILKFDKSSYIGYGSVSTIIKKEGGLVQYHRAIELFFLKAKEEFDKRKTERGGDTERVKVNYFGCTFENGKVQLNGQRVVHGGVYPLILPETHIWEEGAKVFEGIMQDTLK